MTGVELREAWPSLSPRERDARVAEARGWTLYEKPWPGEPGKVQYALPPNYYARQKVAPIPWTLLKVKILWESGEITIPGYATSWEHAGPLLDKLREEGWGYWLMTQWTGVESQFACCLNDGAGRRLEVNSAASPQDAIALAFCLSRESSS